MCFKFSWPNCIRGGLLCVFHHSHCVCARFFSWFFVFHFFFLLSLVCLSYGTYWKKKHHQTTTTTLPPPLSIHADWIKRKKNPTMRRIVEHGVRCTIRKSIKCKMYVHAFTSYFHATKTQKTNLSIFFLFR